MVTPTLALIMSFWIGTPAVAGTIGRQTAEAPTTCAYSQQKRSDLKVLTDFDDYLIDSFQSKNSTLLSEINLEALQVYTYVRYALSIENDDIASLAKRLKSGTAFVKGKNVRRIMDAKIMRELPKFLSSKWFYQENYKDGKFVLGPVFNWPKETIAQVATDQVPMGFSASAIRKIRREGKGFAPVINNPNVESQITIDGEFKDDIVDPKFARKPWEIAIYGTLKTKDHATQYPPVHVNNNQNKADTFNVEYRTVIYLLDISNGERRVVSSPPVEYRNLRGKDIGSARVVSNARIQRLALEQELSTCN